MSNADTRQAIAEALSTVTGIHGHPARPAAFNEGDAWPQWRGAEYGGGHAYVDTWAVLIVLPQADDITADSFADSHLEQLLDALRPVLFIESIAPATIPVEGNPQGLYALMLSGRSE